MTSRAGFTLLEVMVALLVITIGLLGFAGTLGPVAFLAGQGRAQGRMALVLEARLDRLRAELARGCAAPAAGVLQHADGVIESWSVSAAGGLLELRVAASTAGTRPLADTLVTLVRCP